MPVIDPTRLERGCSRRCVDRHGIGRIPASLPSAETRVLGLVLTNAVGRPLAEYLRGKIWQPMGAEADATWIIDAAGQEATYCCLNAVLRDYARFGLLLAHDGRLGDRQIIPKSWLLEATTVPADRPDLKLVWPDTRFGMGRPRQSDRRRSPTTKP